MSCRTCEGMGGVPCVRCTMGEKIAQLRAENEKLRARLAEVERERDDAISMAKRAAHDLTNMMLEERARAHRAAAELERLRAVADAARQAYRADAVAEWFDAEGDGLRAALAALDAER